MPFFGRQGILAKTSAAAPNGGYFQNEFFDSTAQKAINLRSVHATNWHSLFTTGTYTIMFWMKGQRSDCDTAYGNTAGILRTVFNSDGDNGIFCEVNDVGINSGLQQNNGTFKTLEFFPTNFDTNYLNNQWHHFIFQMTGSTSKMYVDGVDKTGDAGTGVPNATLVPNGSGVNSKQLAIMSATNQSVYNGFRTSKLKFCDLWIKLGDNGGLNVASNIGSIYNSGWKSLGTNGRGAGNVLPAPDIFWYVDSGGNIQNGGATTASWEVLKGTVNANLITSTTDGPAGV